MSVKHLDFQNWETYIKTSMNLGGNSYFVHVDQEL